MKPCKHERLTSKQNKSFSYLGIECNLLLGKNSGNTIDYDEQNNPRKINV